MFSVYDKDAGAFMDLREIMEFKDDDFADNTKVQTILKQMNEQNPIAELPIMTDPSMMESSTPTGYYISHTKLSSFPLQSRLEGANNEENLKSMAIIQNRSTQFNTLQLPVYVEEAIKKERKIL
jgi:hypothetical protein